MSEIGKDLLEKEFDSGIEQLSRISVDTNEYELGVKNVKVLHDMIIERDRLRHERYKIEADNIIKEKEIDAEADANLARLYEQRKDRMHDGIFKGLGLVCTILVSGVTLFAEESRNIISKVPQLIRLVPKL